MKLLILGSEGMAGHVITTYLKNKNYQVLTAARNNADLYISVEDQKSIDSCLYPEFKFDYVINCIGALVGYSNTNPDKAILINSWFPHYIESVLKNTNTKLIHLSTDCVFDGTSGFYTETSEHTEKNVYGRSKSLGEINNNKDITFRMSIIGPELKDPGTGLFNFIYKNKNKDLSGWDNAWWNGITTLQLAKCIEQYINDPRIVGIYNVVNNQVNINKFDLLSKINTIFNLDKNIARTQGPKNINKILVDTRDEFNFNIPNYDTQLTELKQFMSNYNYN